MSFKRVYVVIGTSLLFSANTLAQTATNVHEGVIIDKVMCSELSDGQLDDKVASLNDAAGLVGGALGAALGATVGNALHQNYAQSEDSTWATAVGGAIGAATGFAATKLVEQTLNLKPDQQSGSMYLCNVEYVHNNVKHLAVDVTDVILKEGDKVTVSVMSNNQTKIIKL